MKSNKANICKSYLQKNFLFRYGHTAVVYDGKIYIWGGRNDRASCNTLFCFDTIWHCWTAPKTTGNIPPARDGHTACQYKNFMFIFGGYEEDSQEFAKSVYCLDFNTMHWSYVYSNGKNTLCLIYFLN